MKVRLAGILTFVAVALLPEFMYQGILKADEGDAEKTEEKVVISMTPEQVARFIEVLPEFLDAFPDYNPVRHGLPSSPVKPDMDGLNAEENLLKLNEFSARNGYKNFEEFTRHFSGTITGYAYLKTVEAKEMFDAQAKTLPPETAALFSAQMAPLLQSMEELRKSVSPELIQALKPRMSDLDKIMGVTR
ncbi:MAG: hypothetical protein JW808_06050 [Victivallales bacterium]|nr:hypothetical protein [Victivallales bacterium]